MIESQNAITLDTEIRKLRPAELCTLGQILNISDSWKKLMAIVPEENSENVAKFNSEHFSMIEHAVNQQRRSAAEIFLDEWGTMGRKRPTLRTLLKFLVAAELFRAADYVAGDILKDELPKRPESGPAAAVDISEETIVKLLEEQTMSPSNVIADSSILGSTLELNMSEVKYPPDTGINVMAHCSIEHKSSLNGLLTDEKQNKELVGIAKMQDMSDLIKFSTDKGLDIKHSILQDPSSDQNDEVTNPPLSQFRQSVKDIDVVNINHHSSYVPICVYEKQEITSQELPACLNQFAQPTLSEKSEIRLEDLPLSSDNNTFSFSSNSTSSDNNKSNNSMFGLAPELQPNIEYEQTYLKQKNCIEQVEMKTAELPQCIIELQPNLESVGSNDIHTSITKKKDQILLTSEELPITVLEYNK